MINTEHYLNRTHYTGNINPSYEVLCDLQSQHLYHIPFESFNIHDNVPIELTTPVYKFSLAAFKIDDFFKMCKYHQTSEQSHFTQKRLISLATNSRRVTLSGNTLSQRCEDEIREKSLTKKNITRR